MLINPRRMREGYGTCFVTRSFIRSLILSIALQRSAITSTRRLRYEQAKHDHGLQCDSWILPKCLCSRAIAGSPWRPSWSSLWTKTLMVGCLVAFTFVLYCTTVPRLITARAKPIVQLRDSCLLTCSGHAHPWSALCCLLFTNLAAGNLASANLCSLQQFLYPSWRCNVHDTRGSCEICSFIY